MLGLHKIIRASHIVSCPIVSIFFKRLPGGEYSKLWKKIFYSVFSRLDPFPQVFRRVKECLVLQLHEIVRVVHEVAYPIVFILFYK